MWRSPSSAPEAEARRPPAEARRALSFDRYRDSAWRLLIQAHEQAADLSAAQSARQQYARVLSELGAVSPAAGVRTVIV